MVRGTIRIGKTAYTRLARIVALGGLPTAFLAASQRPKQRFTCHQGVADTFLFAVCALRHFAVIKIQCAVFIAAQIASGILRRPRRFQTILITFRTPMEIGPVTKLASVQIAIATCRNGVGNACRIINMSNRKKLYRQGFAAP